jgi:hypothetical protein
MRQLYERFPQLESRCFRVLPAPEWLIGFILHAGDNLPHFKWQAMGVG